MNRKTPLPPTPQNLNKEQERHTGSRKFPCKLLYILLNPIKGLCCTPSHPACLLRKLRKCLLPTTKIKTNSSSRYHTVS